MKKAIFMAFIAIGCSTLGVAQLNTNTKSKTEKVDNRTDAEKIASYKYHLKSLDQKEEWIRSNPEEFKIAQEEGWFENAARTRKELKAKIAELENKSK